MALQHLRSSTANKRPVPGNMSDGQLGINTNLASPGLFFKDTNGDLVKVGPVHVGTTAPNASPAAGGTAGNSVGEQWLDTTGGTYVFKVWDGSAWRSESGTFVDVNGDVMTGALGIIAGSAGSPGLYFSGDTNTGIYSPGADQVAISTNGTGRLFVDANGRVGVGTSSPGALLHLAQSAADAVAQIDGGSSSTAFIDFRIAGANKSYVGLGGLTGGSNNDLINYNSSAGNWIAYTNGSERLRITSAGLVGVGTSSPAKLLEVNEGDIQIRNSSTASLSTLLNYGLTFRGTNQVGQDRGTIAEIKPYLGGGSDNDFGLQFRTQTTTISGITTKMTLTPGGSLGIGTASPGAALEIVGGSVNNVNTPAVFIQNDRFLTFKNTTGTWAGAASATASNNFLIAAVNNLTLATGANADERARIDSSGRLLVGTSSARGVGTSTNGLAQLETTSYVALSAVNNTNDTGGCAIVLGKSRGTTVGSINIVQSGDDLGTILFAGADGTDLETQAASIKCVVDGTPGADDMPGRIVLATTADGASSPTERMRIDSTGRCFFNTTASPSTSSFGTAIGTVLAHSRDTSTGAVAQIYGNAGEFRIIGSGNAQNTNNSYGAISDQSLKTDISDAGSQWDDIKGITVRKFKLIGTDTLQIGVVAQECELVSPGLVEDTVLEQEDGTTSTVKAVKYSVLYMKAVKALQEAMERIEQLEQRLAAAGI